MATTTHHVMSAAELLQLPDDNMRHELVRGHLITMTPSGSHHGVGTIRVGKILAAFIDANDVGLPFGAETGFVIERDPDTVLAPDFSFVKKDRIPAGGPPKGFFPGAPDLAVEVLSPSDRKTEVENKVRQWLAAGAAQVWTIDLKLRTISVHASAAVAKVFRDGDFVDGGELLPGFSARVEELLPDKD